MKKIEDILDNTENDTILFLGKFLHIAKDDLEKFTKKLGFNFATNYNESDKIALVVLSSILNPIEEELSYTLYDAKVPDCKLEEFESFYAKSIKPNSLIMALKLSNNQDRLISFLKSQAIDNELFLKLFKLYNWGEDGLFDSDSNRDIALAFINRFFDRRNNFNHNDVAHSPASILDIALTTSNANVLEALLKIPNYKINARKQEAWKPKSLKEFIAINPNITNDIKRYLLNLNNPRIDAILALNSTINKDEQLLILSRKESMALKNLAKNSNLDIEVFKKLVKEPNIKETLLQNQKITKEHLDLITKDDYILLAKNPNIKEIANKILNIDRNLDFALSSNMAIESKELAKLYKKYKADIALEISQNPNTPSDILEELYKLQNQEITQNLAANPATPQYIIDELCAKDKRQLNIYLAKNPNIKDEYIEFFKLDNELLRIMSKEPKLVEKIAKKEYI